MIGTSISGLGVCQALCMKPDRLLVLPQLLVLVAPAGPGDDRGNFSRTEDATFSSKMDN